MRVSSNFTSLPSSKLPCLQDELYQHCEVAHVQLRVSAEFSSVLYFVERHSCLLQTEDCLWHSTYSKRNLLSTRQLLTCHRLIKWTFSGT